MLQVLSFNSSPKMDKGCTALILDPFLQGMEAAGAEVERFYLRKLRIEPCQGEKSCWLKTDGRCIQDDDMTFLYPKVRKADIIVFGAPVFVDGMPGPLKNLIDRLIPLVDPLIEIRDGHCRHRLLQGHKRSKVALVSTCGFWEMDNFDQLIAHVEAICKNLDYQYAGAVLRPHSDALSYMLRKNLPVADILEAAGEAGKQLAKDGAMRDETLKTVARPLGSREEWLQKLNGSFTRILNKRVES